MDENSTDDKARGDWSEESQVMSKAYSEDAEHNPAETSGEVHMHMEQPTRTTVKPKDAEATQAGIESSNVDDDTGSVIFTGTNRLSPQRKGHVAKRLKTFHTDFSIGEDWLTDEHINASQALLAAKFPRIHGFQHCGLFVAGNIGLPVGTPMGPFVQIVNIENCHWVCLTNINAEPGTIFVYDSMTPTDIKLPMQRAIAWMVKCIGPSIRVIWPQFQHQYGGADCGLFAIAAATALCEGYHPSRLHFNQGMMREHLKQCFTHSTLQMFPHIERRQAAKGFRKEQCFPIHCICRQPNDEHLTIRCHLCYERFHPKCLGLASLPCKYTCGNCTGWGKSGN